MVRRIVTVTIVLGACIAAVVLTGASDESVGKVYRAEFDNAFGLSEGGDLRIGGVNAGQTTTFSLCGASGEPPCSGSDSELTKAVVEFQISEPGFDSLREDARCEIRQQSLIGEYYVDCQPGTSEEELPEGGTIPVEQTASVIPTDLVNNVLREPYRERLRLIIAELGTGLAGRPEDLAETIQRAHPGLRETNEVLAILGQQTDVLRNFVEDSDDVIDDLAAKRADVVRFVREAGETAEITATRREELAQQFERLPTFLAELDPTMVRLGQLADAQIPLLADLDAASDELNTFFTRLGPFSQASRPAIRTLGDTSVVGRRAIRESANEVRKLREVARGANVVGEPLRQFLQTLDDRDRAITTDDRAAITDPPSFDRESLENRTNRDIRKARGFTGFEALMNFAFWQTLTTNSFDGVSHFLRILGVVDEGENGCSPYGTGQPTRGRIDRCNSYLGPVQPGVANATGTVGGGNQGPAKDLGGADRDFTGNRRSAGGASARSSDAESRAASDTAEGERDEAAASAKGQGDTRPQARSTDDLPTGARSMINRARPGTAAGGEGGSNRAGNAARSSRDPAEEEAVPGAGVESQGGTGGASSEELLNFLLGP